MATYTGSFTINANDNGNLSAYNLFSAGTYSTGNGMNNNNLIDDMNAMQFGMQSFFGGIVSYTFSVSSSWLSPSVVNWTIVDPVNIPQFIYITTENYYYTLQLETQTVSKVCNDCQFIQLTQCGTDSFYLNLGLPDGSYTTYWADNTSGVMWEQGTYSGEGGLSVYQWSATAGMFNTYSFYTLTIKDSTGTPVSWTVDGVEYNCATVTFKTTVNVTD